ncbi:MAG: FAD-dependent oxidoreductase [Betaproteobacteria bacterium HGW-Betaproteobacteria-5]|jgi:L-2-hydroxyglutarate oxidase LhgO|nr:MAG: FAD-dependent oxidoreductase [Betaproteobacteria bacterium HGW-Betaproteobacteria-5]PKO30654.1 MAG: FAD-dependent oxidoreductase [Betaproteobacteria bacterium HGW-Betaproteobacteria-7]
MTYKVDAVVVGAGVVGLACAVRLARLGLQTVVLEKESRIGQGISSRSSEVIHAGLYYPLGSLKARLCRRGADMLYRYCERRSVTHRKVGKFVVAVEEGQIHALEVIASRARQNSCRVDLISGRQAVMLEPELRCAAALHSLDTGIIDSHGLMEALLGEFESAGGIFARCSALRSGHFESQGAVLELDDGESTRVTTRHVVNAAGIDAPLVAGMFEDFPDQYIPQRCFAKGTYFSLSGKSPFSRMIYPVPESGGLGVHLTIDLQGQARFGPDVEWVIVPEYNVAPSKRRQFYDAIRSYWPNCSEDRLNPGYAGVRPKLGTPASFADDFVIQSSETHGVAGLINLFGIESPGLTSCLAIADEVAARLGLNELKDEE